MKIKILLFVLMLSSAVVRAENTVPGGFSGRPERQLLELMVSQRMTPDIFVYDWKDATFLKALEDTYRLDESLQPRIALYAQQVMTRFMDSPSGIHPNAVATAGGFAFLKEIGLGSERNDKAIASVLEQYLAAPHSDNGACTHRPGRVELWDDTVFMLQMFLLGCYSATGENECLDMISREVIAHAEHLEDSRTGMWYHGWSPTDEPVVDECCVYGWNSNPEHRNGEFWGRGNGWVAMTYADVLSFLPSDHPAYENIRSRFLKMAATLVKCQDRKTGMWYQLPLRGKDKCNFLESSCTAMFSYAFAKGVRLGILPANYLAAAKRAYQGIVDCCVTSPGTDSMHMNRICAGTCIGERDYYYARKIISDDSYAIGAFILLGNELIRSEIR